MLGDVLAYAEHILVHEVPLFFEKITTSVLHGPASASTVLSVEDNSAPSTSPTSAFSRFFSTFSSSDVGAASIHTTSVGATPTAFRDVAGSFVVWCLVYLAAVLFNKWYLFKDRTTMLASRRMYFDGSVATSVFSVVVGGYGCWIWLTKNAATQADRVFGHDVRVDFVARLMISFFVLNLIVDHVVRPVVKMVETKAPVQGRSDEEEVSARVERNAGEVEATPVVKTTVDDTTETHQAEILAEKRTTDQIKDARGGKENLTVSAASEDELSETSTTTPSCQTSSAPPTVASADHTLMAVRNRDKERRQTAREAAMTTTSATSAGARSCTPASSTSFVLDRKKKPAFSLSEETALLLHHIAAITLLAITLVPFAQYHASALILWELSTPFLNYRIIGLELGWNKSCTGRINTFACMQAGFGISFLCARIVIGLPSSVFCCCDMVRMMLFRHAETFALMWSGRSRPGADHDGDLRQQMLAWSAPSDQEMDSYLLAWCTCAGNLVLCVLNVFWAWKIVTRARKLHFSGGDAAAHSKKAAD